MYLLAVIGYFIIALAGNKYYSYVDVDTLNLAEKKYMGQMVFASILIGVGFCVACAKLWPVAYSYTKYSFARFFMLPLGFVCLSYFWNTGVFRLINVPAKREMHVKGEVVRKFFESYGNTSLRRRKKRGLYVEIEDTATRYVYLFKCRENAYNSVPDIGGHIDKTFIVGRLGIIYRKDP
jgi:hypothetical protein